MLPTSPIRASFGGMGLTVERVPTLGDNYTYVIACDETGEAAIIDAPEFDPVEARVAALERAVAKHEDTTAIAAFQQPSCATTASHRPASVGFELQPRAQSIISEQSEICLCKIDAISAQIKQLEGVDARLQFRE